MRILICVFLVLVFSCSREGNPTALSEIDKITKLQSLDEKLPAIVAGDWLNDHKETGQTLSQYQNSNPVKLANSQQKIYLQPIGNFSKQQDSLVLFTAEYLEIFFDLEVELLKPLNDSLITSGNRRVIEEGHTQFWTKFILDSLLAKSIPSDAIVVMAITATDLYPQESWNFVFGEAYTKRRIGITSMNRFYESESDYGLCLRRLIKTASHEISHMFSILHCTHAVCAMNGTNHLGETDRKPNRLCTECLSKLYWNLKFDNKQRFEKLCVFFKKYKLLKDYELSLKDLMMFNLLAK